MINGIDHSHIRKVTEAVNNDQPQLLAIIVHLQQQILAALERIEKLSPGRVEKEPGEALSPVEKQLAAKGKRALFSRG